MDAALDQLNEWFSHPGARAALRAAAIAIAGVVTGRIVGSRIARLALRPQHQFLARRLIVGVIYGVALVWALSELGLSVGVILGAAGVLTVAIGFAAQTAVSNLISGLFLVVERPFELGDVIETGNRTGEVVAIDLMSTKLRTFDNLYVRIPNEVLLKAEVVNLTHYDIRRHDLKLTVSYETDLDQLRDILLAAAKRVPLCLDEPAPAFLVLELGQSGIGVQYSAWGHRTTFIEMRNQLQREVVETFASAGIEIPFPQRALSARSPIPVELIGR